MLDNTWFLSPQPDFEREQYKVLGFLQSIDVDFKAEKLDPGLFEVKYQLNNIESFITTQTILPRRGTKHSRKELDRMEWFNSLYEKSDTIREINDILKWSFKKLQEKYKEGAQIWKSVEASLNLFYVGDIPQKIENGYLLVRYGGSHITEVYSFEYNDKKKAIEVVLKNYEDKDYGDIRSDLKMEAEYKNPAFIGIESLHSFDTVASVIPIVKTIISNHMITNKISTNLLHE